MENATMTIEYLQQQLLISQTQILELRNTIQELQHKHHQVKELSGYDHLTELYNRNYLYEYLETLKTHSDHISLAFIDIDHFKKINTTFDTRVGDETLKCIATLLKRFSRKIDTVFRYSGEEFVVVFPDANLQEALVACERFRNNLQYHNWSTLHPKLRVTVSVGVVTGKTIDYELLLDKAATKVSQAQEAGRNCVKY